MNLKYSVVVVTGLCASLAVGALATLGNPSLLALTSVVPAIWLFQPSRRTAYSSACCYYLAALWQIPGVLHSLPGTSRLDGLESVTIWLCAAALLSLPWALAWNHDSRRVLWLTPIAQALSIVPPLGLIGLACPASAAGLLLPGAGWFGFAVVLVLPGVLVAWPRGAPLGLVASIALIHLTYDGGPRAPRNWEGINTNRRPTLGLVQQYEAIDEVLSLSLRSSADVVVFPETTVSTWTSGADAYFGEAIAELKARGKTVLIGSTVEIPPPVGSAVSLDISGAIRVLNGDSEQGAPLAVRSESRYRNLVVIRGGQSGLFAQRIPVPIGMWHPFSGIGVPLNLTGPTTIEIWGQRAAILICYEQLLAWPILTSLLQKPTIVVGIANSHLPRLGSIPDLQALYLRSWARLFGLPTVTAMNR